MSARRRAARRALAAALVAVPCAGLALARAEEAAAPIVRAVDGMLAVPSAASAAEGLSVNGLPFAVAWAGPAGDVATFMDGVEARCDGAFDGDALDPGDPAPARPARGRGILPPLSRGILRVEREGHALVACFERTGEGSLVDRLAGAARTGDLAALGRLHVALGRTNGSTASAVRLTAVGSLSIPRAFPARGGDAPGGDVDGVPRPPSSVRRLSVGPIGGRTTVAVYSSDAPRDAVLEHLRAALGPRALPEVPGGAIAVRVDAGWVVVTASEERDGTWVVVLTV